MIKHICFMEAKGGFGGSWGVGDDAKKAEQNARKALGEKSAKIQTTVEEVPEGHKLVIREQIDGITWWTEPTDND